MKVKKTKVQLISLIADFLLDHFIASENKLVVTSANDCPEQSQKGERIVQEDMKTTHEEADVIIPQQVMYAMKEGRQILTERADDTDILVLLCHFHFDQQWTIIDLFMESFGSEKSLICIRSSVQRNRSIMPSLLSAHAFGCDTVPSMSGIGKKTILKAVSTHPLTRYIDSIH